MSKELKALGKKYAEAIKNNPGKSMAARKARKTACLEYEAAVKEEKNIRRREEIKKRA